MLFSTLGDKKNKAILFFHAMGVTGDSSTRVAEYLKDEYFCIMPTSTVYVENQKYISKQDEIRQVEEFLKENDIHELELVVASSIGVDLAIQFLSQTKVKIHHAFFDGGQFAQINKFTRRLLTPILYYFIHSLYKKNGRNLGKIMWCDDEEIRPYFVQAGKYLKYSNLKRQLSDTLENKPFPIIEDELQKHCFFEFGSIEDHFKYRDNVKKAYRDAHFPVFENYNHMQYQIRDPKGFALMLLSIIKENELPSLPFLRDEK